MPMVSRLVCQLLFVNYNASSHLLKGKHAPESTKNLHSSILPVIRLHFLLSATKGDCGTYSKYYESLLCSCSKLRGGGPTQGHGSPCRDLTTWFNQTRGAAFRLWSGFVGFMPHHEGLRSGAFCLPTMLICSNFVDLVIFLPFVNRWCSWNWYIFFISFWSVRISSLVFWKWTGFSILFLSDFLPGSISSVQINVAFIKNRPDAYSPQSQLPLLGHAWNKPQRASWNHKWLSRMAAISSSGCVSAEPPCSCFWWTEVVSPRLYLDATFAKWWCTLPS